METVGPLISAHRTDLARGAAALVVGALTGATGVAVELFAPDLVTAGGLEKVLLGELHAIEITFFVALFIWSLGLIVLGVPMWWLFHRLNWRAWPAAMALGASLTFVVSVTINTGGLSLINAPFGSSYTAGDSGGDTVVNNKLTPHGWAEALNSALRLAGLGGAVGWVIWRTAYRRSAPK